MSVHSNHPFTKILKANERINPARINFIPCSSSQNQADSAEKDSLNLCKIRIRATPKIAMIRHIHHVLFDKSGIVFSKLVEMLLPLGFVIEESSFLKGQILRSEPIIKPTNRPIVT